MMRTFGTTKAAIAIALASGAAIAQDSGATANMVDTNGNAIGSVSFSEGPHGVLVRADLGGLPAGWHGFHVHQTGSCDNEFAAAGGHFNPSEESHGLLFGDAHHAGDLPNLGVTSGGSAMAHFFTDAFTLAEGDAASLNDADGAAVIVHENPDSYGEDAGAGGRIACGVIEFGG